MGPNCGGSLSGHGGAIPALPSRMGWCITSGSSTSLRVVLETGERQWEFGGEQHKYRRIDLTVTPAVTGDSVYVNGYEQRDTMYGKLFVIDRATGRERDHFTFGRNQELRSTPAVADELVFANASDGRLFALGECDTELLGRCLVG